MANPTILAEIIRSIGQALGIIVRSSQQTQDDARGARVAAESAQPGNFHVLEGMPAGSDNARSLTSMLSGMKRKAIPTPRMRNPGVDAGMGGAEPPEPKVNTENIAHWLGKSVGNIFRRLTGVSPAAAAGSSAVGAAGQTGMTGGLLVRGGSAALGLVGGMASSPIGMGLTILGVSKALQGFGERINEQSRDLRKYNSGMNAGYAGVDVQREVNKQRKAAGTSGTNREALDAQIEAERAWLPLDTLWTNAKNKMSKWANNAAAFGYKVVAAPFQSSGYGKAAEQAEERNLSPEAREKRRLSNLETRARISESLIMRPSASMPKQLPGPAALPEFGALAAQMRAGNAMMGLNPPHALGMASIDRIVPGDPATKGAAFEADQLSKSKGVQIPSLKPVVKDKKAITRDEYDEERRRRREEFEKAHPGVAQQEEKLLASKAWRRKAEHDEAKERINKPLDPDDPVEAGLIALRQENLQRSQETRQRRKEELDRMMESRRNKASLLKPGEVQ